MNLNRYALALDAVQKIDHDLTTGRRHYRTSTGTLLTTLDQVIQAVIDGEFIGQETDSEKSESNGVTLRVSRATRTIKKVTE